VLLDTAETDPATIYTSVTPPLQLGLPFVATAVRTGYIDWPRLPELLPTWRPPETSPFGRDHDSLFGVTDGDVRCGVKPGFSISTSA
jgi:hypothetical protein